MIEMFIHSAAPLLRCERAKEKMRLACTPRFATFLKLPYFLFELFPFPEKIALVRHHQTRVSGAVPRKWLLIAVHRFHQRPDQPADKHARQIAPPGSHVQRRRTMRHHLTRIHFSPLPRRFRLQPVQARQRFVHCFRLEKVLHHAASPRNFGNPAGIIAPGQLKTHSGLLI